MNKTEVIELSQMCRFGLVVECKTKRVLSITALDLSDSVHLCVVTVNPIDDRLLHRLSKFHVHLDGFYRLFQS